MIVGLLDSSNFDTHQLVESCVSIALSNYFTTQPQEVCKESRPLARDCHLVIVSHRGDYSLRSLLPLRCSHFSPVPPPHSILDLSTMPVQRWRRI